MKSRTGFQVVVVATLGVLPYLACTNADVEFTTVSEAGSEPATRAGGGGSDAVGGSGSSEAGFGATLADAGVGGVSGEAGEAGASDSGGTGDTGGSGSGGLPNVGGSGNAGYSGGGVGGSAGGGGIGGSTPGGGAGGGGVAGSAGSGGVAGGAGSGGVAGGAAGGGAGGSAGRGGAGAGGAGASGAGAGGGSAGGTAGSSAVCGNQLLEKGEQCDDGNSKNLDACAASCDFEQSQRANAVEQAFLTSSLCPNNAFGAAFVGAGRSALQAILSQRVANGSLSLLFAFRGLTDLSGMSTESIWLGMAYGAPSVAPNYDGKSDLDWWYTPAAGQVDENGVLYSNSAASLLSGVMNASPGKVQLPLLSDVVVTLSGTKVRLTLGASSEPLASSGVAPGHLASEHLRPGLVSFASSVPTPSSGDSRQLCGNLSAASLSATKIPAAYASGGASPCSEGYAASRSFLDLLLGGCTIDGDQVVLPTQPDQSDPSAPQGGAGAPYRFSTSDSTHAVTACRDQENAIVPVRTCLNAAAYSSAYRLKTGRVIIK